MISHPFHSQNRSEIELLLCCARVEVDETIARRIEELLEGQINWEWTLHIASFHGVMPLLASQLTRFAAPLMPAAVLQTLRDNLCDNAARNFRLAGELEQIMALFEANGIVATPFKGPMLALLAYSNLSLREFCDLDILVEERSVARAVELLGTRGYRGVAGQEHPNFLENCEHHLESENGLNVDLHWKVARDSFFFHFGARDWQSDLQTVTLLGTPVSTLDPTTALLLHCAHGGKHHWEKLKWVCDVAELVRAHPDLNWSELILRSRQSGSLRMVLLGLYLARKLLGAKIPVEIERHIGADPKIRALARPIQNALWQVATPGKLTGAESVELLSSTGFFHFQMRERRRDRARFAWSQIKHLARPSPKDRAAFPLVARSGFLLYFLRPIRLLCQHQRVSGLRFKKRPAKP